ncbi:RRT5 [Candida jiufengensis]|uniref:RRT5 n=1 Tax=Candida jiufengensis TaxID=497108 RepID=UPI0022250865|nr:RRT5 [Candida jiufengensis]KAI5951647.1 RRT5 [Candida jiufengensis]
MLLLSSYQLICLLQSLPTMTAVDHTHYRVYLKNLGYHTTEEDLYTLFKKFEPVNILVPSYTVRFTRSGKHKSLGFAYVELKSSEEVEQAVKDFNGTVFNGKRLIVKAYSPYTPGKRFLFFKKSKSVAPSEDEEEEVAEENNFPIDVNNNATLNSRGSLFIPKARGEVTESKVEEFLKDYNPSDIIIMKKKSKINPISYVSVLASVDTSQNKLNDIIQTLKNQKLNGRKVDLQEANPEKVEQIERELQMLAVQIENQEESANDDLPETNEANISPASNFDIAPPPNPTPEGLTMSSNFTEPITS